MSKFCSKAKCISKDSLACLFWSKNTKKKTRENLYTNSI